MKKIALSREQMEKLGCLGIDVSNASMRYERFGSNNIVDSKIVFTWDNWKLRLGYNDSKNCNNYQVEPALTLQDIMEMLPNVIWVGERVYDFILTAEFIGYNNGLFAIERGDDLLDDACSLLCWVKENGHLKQ